MKETENQEDYKDSIEDSIVDVDEITTTEIKINPDFYIHMALLKAQKALTKDNMKEGLIQFRFLIEHIETLCQAANKIPSNYIELIANFKNSEEYNKNAGELGEIGKSMKLANYKIYLLFKEICISKQSTEPLRF